MERIAIIDDNMVFRKLTKVLLKRLGISDAHILLFKNGSEMLKFMRNNINDTNILPSVLLLDLNMPVMDGWEFLNRQEEFSNKYGYDPEIYIITSSVDDKDYNRAKQIKIIKGYLTKPIDENDLGKIINEISHSLY